MAAEIVKCLPELIQRVQEHTKTWKRDGFIKPWFRGVSSAEKHKLLPSIYRYERGLNREFDLTKKFRLMAPGFGKTPETGRIDQWLFLMQHHGVPTRLLDWTESPLVAAFFATNTGRRLAGPEEDAAIFVIDPHALNSMAGMNSEDAANFPNTWVQSRTLQTIKLAFGTETDQAHKGIYPFENPVAIYPSTIHSRMPSQKSCFTLHGKNPNDIGTILNYDSEVLLKFVIPKDYIASLARELQEMGVTNSMLFPDFDGLARELKVGFGMLE
ncbi:FRG domain-containing protein [Kordiimonas sp.]|uniref:FRG domain-containing protein n=1 Tax=Kordiimonas sp. TaxID=1970157 RepID=UPI003A8D66BF